MINLILALAAAVGIGLLSRLAPLGWEPYDKSLGDVLYAVAAYLGIALLLSRRRPTLVAALALAACVAVEAFQATGVPARYADVAAVRWLVGTEFAWHDVGCYVVGVALVWPLDVLWLRRPAKRTSCAATDFP